MRFLRQGLNVLLLIGMILGVQGQGQKCSRYHSNNGLCVNYRSNGDYVYDEGKGILNLENSFSSLASAQGLTTLRENDTFLVECVQAFTSFVCATTFPKCINYSSTANTQVEVELPCLSTCSNAIRHCRTNLESAPPETQDIIKAYILSSKFFPPDCAGNIGTSPPLNIEYPTDNCDSSPQLSDIPKCFQPLIVDKKWVESNKSVVNDPNFCDRGCCLPCPQAYALYPSKQLERGFLATQLFRAFSAIGSGIMFVLYMILPGKRTHPSTLILFTAISIYMYSSNVFFSILRPSKVQCVNDVVPSTQENNPFFCGFQGALLMFASHATALWIGLIILNLHVHTVWNSNIMKDKYIYFNVIGWGIPAILTIIALGKRSIQYQFGTLCFVQVDLSNVLFFYPLAIVIIPSFFIHMSTFVYIYRISQKEEQKEQQKDSEFMTNRLHVLQVIKIQWRSLLLAIILLTTIIFYWLFYFVELKKIAYGASNANFIAEWTPCIQLGNGQDYCAKHISSKYVPPFSLLFTAEMSVSLIGIHLVVIFFNGALWQECKQWIVTKFSNTRDMEFLAI